MEDEIRAGTVLVKANTLMPEGLRLEAEPFIPEWSVVKGYDGCGLDRAIQEKGWTFFFLAGEVKATVFGTNRHSMLRRTIAKILAQGKADNFNCLEITKVSSVGAARFPWFSYLTVSAKWRHIQKSLWLVSGTQRPGLNTKRASISLVPRMGSDAVSLLPAMHQQAVEASVEPAIV